jgi:hypothetical protein
MGVKWVDNFSYRFGNKNNAWRNEGEVARLMEEARPTFIRYTPPPPGGESIRSWRTGATEGGLSVFQAYQKENGDYVVDPGEMLETAVYYLLLHHVSNVPVYEATGTRIKTGSGLEPILKPFKLEPIDHSLISGCTWVYHIDLRMWCLMNANRFQAVKEFCIEHARDYSDVAGYKPEGVNLG